MSNSCHFSSGWVRSGKIPLTSGHAKNLRIGGKPKGEGLDHVGQLKAGEKSVARVVCGFF